MFRDLYTNRLVRYAVSLALLGLVAWRVNLGHLVAALGSVRPQYLATALALTVPFLYCKALRWHLMLRQARVETTLAEASISLLGGMGLALLTPARLGELVRVAYLRDSRKLRIGGLVLVDKGFDVLTLAGLSVAGAWLLLGPGPGAALAVAAVAGLVLVYRPRAVTGVLGRATMRAPLAGRMREAWSSLESLSPASSTVFLALTVFSFAIVMLQFAVILLSWHSWSLDAAVLTFPLVILTNVLPITVGGLGVREATAAVLLPHFGISAADAAVAAFLMFAANTALPGMVGVFLWPVPSDRPRAGTAHTLDPS